MKDVRVGHLYAAGVKEHRLKALAGGRGIASEQNHCSVSVRVPFQKWFSGKKALFILALFFHRKCLMVCAPPHTCVPLVYSLLPGEGGTLLGSALSEGAGRPDFGRQTLAGQGKVQVSWVPFECR